MFVFDWIINACLRLNDINCFTKRHYCISWSAIAVLLKSISCFQWTILVVDQLHAQVLLSYRKLFLLWQWLLFTNSKRLSFYSRMSKTVMFLQFMTSLSKFKHSASSSPGFEKQQGYFGSLKPWNRSVSWCI